MPLSTSSRLESAGSPAIFWTELRALAHGGAQAVLVPLRIVVALAEDVGLGVVDLEAGHAFDELEDRAVV